MAPLSRLRPYQLDADRKGAVNLYFLFKGSGLFSPFSISCVQVFMRISRAPVPQSATRSNDPIDPGEKQAGTLDGDLVQLPEWQRAFVLGPNVRFTRTPESAMTRKGNGQPVADDAIDETLTALPAAEEQSQ